MKRPARRKSKLNLLLERVLLMKKPRRIGRGSGRSARLPQRLCNEG